LACQLALEVCLKSQRVRPLLLLLLLLLLRFAHLLLPKPVLFGQLPVLLLFPRPVLFCSSLPI
jgi:hypothetical protein